MFHLKQDKLAIIEIIFDLTLSILNWIFKIKDVYMSKSSLNQSDLMIKN